MEDPGRVEIFLQYRPLLLSIAYRMLGSMADAEDLVQETFIRWQASSEAEVRSPRAYLVTILSRLCIHQLESARVQREQYVGPWLPEPVSAAATADPLDVSELQDSLSLAFLLVLERLTPVERAAFLLHDVFGYAYVELVRVLRRNEASCRQIVHRARRHVTENRPRFNAAPELHERLLHEFAAAASSGDLQGLVAVVSDEVVLYSDGGGKANAALRPLHGALHVARFVLGAIEKSVPAGVSVHVEAVNGQASVVQAEWQALLDLGFLRRWPDSPELPKAKPGPYLSWPCAGAQKANTVARWRQLRRIWPSPQSWNIAVGLPSRTRRSACWHWTFWTPKAHGCTSSTPTLRLGRKAPCT